jgi:hypothetical protein
MPKKIKTHLTLSDALKVSYADKKTAKREMKAKGYYYDNKLSNGEEKVFYDPKNKKVLMTVAGTKNRADIITDVFLGLGLVKHTPRFKQAKDTLEKAKKKYGTNATIAGHSLGGQIASHLGQEKDKVITYNKGAGINGGFNSSFHKSEKHYRTPGDILSLMASGNKHTTHLSNPFQQSYNNTSLNMRGVFNDLHKAHNLDNIKDEKIFI